MKVAKEHLVPSEAAATLDQGMDSTARRYHLVFMSLVFFVIPLLLTLHVLWQRSAEVSRVCAWNTPVPYLAFVTLVCVAGNVCLLVRRY